MLVLSRKAEEEIRIGNSVVVRVLRVTGSTVKLGIEAPLDTEIVRGELRREPVIDGEAGLREKLILS